MATMATLQRISAPKLRDLILGGASTGSSIAVVDVRDDDHIGGHIAGSLHFPSRGLDNTTMAGLVRRLQGKDTVVFHCALSQQRGPGAALRYLREREAGVADEAGAREQKVYVLDRGFVGWQELYATDARLTEAYRDELWKDGYWG